ncbi:microtubule-associated protein 70-2-like [Cornus florida]|uniref:microtubule-associated protein 70-2-like n=1 Tax=Cornus florida TaxID=4283 RepID=UPI00289A3BF8|nr:microtubule-associated protein 70-2-like [Cornus florida]
MVDDLQNKNQELMKRIEICQEENKILDKKVAEVEKLPKLYVSLSTCWWCCYKCCEGLPAESSRDECNVPYTFEVLRVVFFLPEERKTLERELARAKVTANRVVVVVANEWKDANDKVMPVKQWLEERRFLQGEMQQLRDKLSVAERTAKSEAQLKEKYQLQLKVLEETLRSSSKNGRSMLEGRNVSNGRRQSLGGADNISKLTSNGFLPKRSPSFQLRSSPSSGTNSVLKHAKGTSKSFDGGTRSLDG